MQKLDEGTLRSAIEAWRGADHNIAAAARKLGFGSSTLRTRLDRAQIEGLLTPADIEARSAGGGRRIAASNVVPMADLSRVEKQGAELRRLRAQLQEIVRDNVDADEARLMLTGLAGEPLNIPRWLSTPLRKHSGVTGVPTVIWSDWHLGEVVRPEEVNGVNSYNLAIAEARIKRLVDRTVDLCHSHMTNPSYPGIVVMLIGDIVSGGIHPELAETDEAEIFPMIVWAVERIGSALAELADKFGHVHVACAPGNHGRVFDRKPRAKRYVYRNADWLIYTLLWREFEKVRKDKRVSFQIPDTGEARFNIYGHRFLAVHGDDLGVKGGDGIIGAIGPIMRGEIKMRHSQAQIGRDYDTLCMGHWHQMLWLPRAIVNNTLKGYDEYARRMLRAVSSTPSQALFFVHPQHGITARWEVLVEGRSAAAKAPWVSWERAA